MFHLHSPRLLSWLIVADVLLGLLLSAAIMAFWEDTEWVAVVLVFTTGLAGMLALPLAQSLSSETLGFWRTKAPKQVFVHETADDLPMHPTTGLYRSWVFHQRLADEVARDRRYNHTFTILLLEPANLFLEPTEEDFAVEAKALLHSLRDGDFAAQFDDERFVVMLPETDDEGAKVAGTRLLAAISSSTNTPIRWRGALVSFPEDGTDPDELLERAVILLRAGRLQSTTESMGASEDEGSEIPDIVEDRAS